MELFEPCFQSYEKERKHEKFEENLLREDILDAVTVENLKSDSSFLSDVDSEMEFNMETMKTFRKMKGKRMDAKCIKNYLRAQIKNKVRKVIMNLKAENKKENKTYDVIPSENLVFQNQNSKKAKRLF